jgi:hypothetical protein
MTDTYTQCKLVREGSTQVSWIPSRGAILGKFVEVKPENDRWEVTEIYGTQPEATIRDNERNHVNHRKATDV